MRQVLWLLIVTLLVFGVWQFFLALRAGRAPKPAASTNADKSAGIARERMSPAPGPDLQPGLGPGLRPGLRPLSRGAESALSRAEPVVSPPSGEVFKIELEVQGLRREVGALRTTVERQQGEITELRTELGKYAAQAQSGGNETVPGASPEYGEALALARRGLAVDEIAARCDITRAEAELVVSLAAGGQRPGKQGDLL
ncbi:hypothetical protein FACS1894154_08840 [Betaproteobacteria bacterium]|nr:hypothetical protein FACS1894154_08840 [Betaproteobacteria bacterium]GHU10114.1 hypothetical protein AGMMS50225_12730 [Betaproteobacteria bacterium]GHU22404.1 hypothetical protein FACS189488_02890 [Betaproteobacteria bacterium]